MTHISIKNRRFRLAGCVAVAFIVTGLLCLRFVRDRYGSSYELNPIRPADFPEVLVPPPAAKSIDYSAPSISKRAPDTYSLSFWVEEPYPADNTHRFILETLSAQGWRRLHFLILAPTVKPEWRARGGDTQDDEVHRWHEDWANAKGEIVSAILQYSVQKATRGDLKQLDVNMTFFGQNSGADRLLSQYKKYHPEEFVGSN